jgi:hypothetical protein
LQVVAVDIAMYQVTKTLVAVVVVLVDTVQIQHFL